jgi:hypothetical protein
MAAASATGRDMNRYLSVAIRLARPFAVQFVHNSSLAAAKRKAGD